MTAKEFLNKYPHVQRVVDDVARDSKQSGESDGAVITRLRRELKKIGVNVTRDIATELFIA